MDKEDYPEAVNIQVISSKECSEYADARYKVVTVTPYVEEPEKKIYLVNQQELDKLLDGYIEYAEFVVSVEMIGGK